jgi:3-dehydrosphinganine reductase
VSDAGAFAGRHVLIGGGSSGIGLATAKAFASRGADVTVVARDEGRLEAAEATIRRSCADTGQRVAAISGDVAGEAGARAAVEAATEDGSRPIDILVNCAGIIVPGNFESMQSRDFERCMDSWRGCVWTTRAAVPHMMERGSGHIVNISSVAGFMGIFGYTAYSSAKYAVMGFSEALRGEMKPHGIRVSVVCPPDTDTPGLTYEKSLRPPETDKIAGNIKPVPPEAVARAIVRGVERGRYLIIPDLTSRIYRVLKANMGWLFFAITDGDVASSRKARGLLPRSAGKAGASLESGAAAPEESRP